MDESGSRDVTTEKPWLLQSPTVVKREGGSLNTSNQERRLTSFGTIGRRHSTMEVTITIGCGLG